MFSNRGMILLSLSSASRFGVPRRDVCDGNALMFARITFGQRNPMLTKREQRDGLSERTG